MHFSPIYFKTCQFQFYIKKLSDPGVIVQETSNPFLSQILSCDMPVIHETISHSLELYRLM